MHEYPITKLQIDLLRRTPGLELSFLISDISARYSILSFRLEQNGLTTVFDFSHAKDQSKIKETLNYISDYLMNERGMGTIILSDGGEIV